MMPIYGRPEREDHEELEFNMLLPQLNLNESKELCRAFWEKFWGEVLPPNDDESMHRSFRVTNMLDIPDL